MSTSPTVPASTSLGLGDNLVNGQPYTFVFQCTNLVSNPSPATLVADLDQSAPDFLTSVNITTTVKNYFNVQFTYEGDGSDIASDVANSMVTAFAVGSNDNFTLTGVTNGRVNAVNPVVALGPEYSFSFSNLLPSFLGGESVTQSQSQQYQAQSTAEITAVGTNAATAYGATSAPATAVAAVTPAQVSAANQNLANIATQANTDNSVAGTTLLLVVGAILVGLYFLLGGVKGIRNLAVAA